MSEKITHFIYFHKNPKTNQIFYVGMGISNGYRHNQTKVNRNQHYHNYVNKHGFPIIEKIHENLSFEDACELEIAYIKKFGRIGYEENGILVNKGLGGEVGARGIKHTQKWKDNHSSMMKIISQTDEFKKRTSETHKGKIVSKETVNKILAKRKIKEKETNAKIKHSLNEEKCKQQRRESISKGREKSIIQYDLNMNPIKEWNSMKEAKINTKIKGIAQAVNKSNRSAGGFKWKYKEHQIWKHILNK